MVKVYFEEVLKEKMAVLLNEPSVSLSRILQDCGELLRELSRADQNVVTGTSVCVFVKLIMAGFAVKPEHEQRMMDRVCSLPPIFMPKED